jgi:nitroreductase
MEVFSAGERAALYRVIESRRDVRAFGPSSIDTETLARILGAAHHRRQWVSCSPGTFIVIRDAATSLA